MYQNMNRWILNMSKPLMLSQPQNISHSSFQLVRETVDSLTVASLVLLWSSILSVRLITVFSHWVGSTSRQHPLWSQSRLSRTLTSPQSQTKAHLLHVLAKSMCYRQCAPSIQWVKARASSQVSAPGSLWLRVGSGQMPKLSIIWSNWQLWRSELGRNLLNKISSYVN